MGRQLVIEALNNLAFGTELTGGNAFGARAWKNAARAVKHLDGDLREMLASGELKKTKGIGASSLKVITEVLDGQAPGALARMDLPEGLFAIGRLRGLGPSKVKALWEQLGITTLGELEYACLENRLVDLPGFGAKTQDKVLAAIAASRETEDRVRLDVAGQLARDFEAQVGVPLHWVGGYARSNEVIDRLEAIVVGPWPSLPPDFVIEDGQAAGDFDGFPVTLVRVKEEGSLGQAMVQHTASAEHWAALCTRGTLPIEAGCDADFYRGLGIHPVPVEQRDKNPTLVPLAHVQPELIQLGDIQGLLHNHTVQSDGVATLRQMRDAAAEYGWSYLGISDHSQSARYASGLPPEVLLAQLDEIAALNAEDSPTTLLSGVESDILRDGSLDYEDEVLAQLEVVIASVHARGSLDREAFTQRMVQAAQHPMTTVIGHPTGRLLLGRPPSDFDVEALLDACAQSGCGVELNAHPHRLDLNEHHLAMAKERGVLVSIAADAHSTQALGHVVYGVAIARRAGLRAEDVLNTLPLAELQTVIDRTERED